MTPKNVKACRRQGGAVLVELALVLPVLLFLTAATVEFSQALASYQVVLKQVRAATRYLSTRAPGSGHVEAECLLRTGQLSAVLPCPGAAVLPGLASAHVQVTVQDALNAPASQRAQLAAVNGSLVSAVRIGLVTVTVTGFRHPLSLAGLLVPATQGASSLAFGAIRMSLRQAG
jgi:hypothetical protein